MISRAVLIPVLLTGGLVTLLPSVIAHAETDPPVVLAVAPDRDSTGVDPATNVAVDFSEEMDPATLTTTSVTLVEVGGTTPLPATVTYDASLHRAVLDPDLPLLATTTYTATVLGGPSGVHDVAGNPLATDEVWSFTTAAPPDADPPETSIDSAPTGTVNTANATVTFSADEAGVTFTCTLDGAPASTCTSPATFTGLADGNHNVAVTATDPAGNADPTPATATWTIDTITPTVNASPPGGTYSSARSVILTASEPAEIRVTTDGSDPTPASPLYTGPIDVAATTTLKFRAVDPAGNTSTIDTETYTIDSGAPETSIDSAPSGTVNTVNATVAFSADEAGVTFTCTLDGAPASTCTSPATFTGLADGTHNVAVAATDPAGNADPTPATATWTIDTTAPTVNASPPGGIYSSARSVTLTASEPAEIRVTTDGSDPTPASPLYAGPIDVATTTTIKFLAVDPAGNTSTIDTETYTIEISPTTVTFGAVADARVEGVNPTTNFGTATPLRVDSSPLEEAYFRFDVSGTNGPVTSARLRVFTTNATINGPAVYLTGNAWTETGLTWNNRPARIGTPSDDLGNVPVSTWVEFDVTPLVDGDGPVSFNLTQTSSDAIHFHSREGTDPALRPQLVVTYSGSPPPPAPLTVSATPAGGTYSASQSVALSASEPATIRYTTDGTDPTAASAIYSSPVPVTASATLKFFAVTPDGRNSGIVTETYTIDPVVTATFAPAADARVEAANPAVNYGTATSLVVDASPQTESYLRFDVSGLSGAVQNAVLRLYMFNATVNGPAVYSAANTWTETGINWNNRPPRTGTGVDDKGDISTANVWVEFNVTSLISGNGTFTLVLATTSSDAASFYPKEWGTATLRPQLVVTAVEGTPPVVTAAPTGGSFSEPVDVTLSASEPATIHYTTNGTDPTPASAIYTGPIHVVQTTTLKFIGIDAGGATSPVAAETYTIAGDFSPPATTIDSAPADPTNLTSATFTFSSDEPGSSFQCALDGPTFTACSTPQTYHGLAPGSHGFQVRATDPAGNVDPTPAGTTWTIDQTPPTVTSVAPADGATGVDVAATVSAVFSEDMNPTTLSGVTVRLVPQGSGTPVPATVTYDGPSMTVTLTPDTILTGGTTYNATVTGGAGGATDRAGNSLAGDQTWSFTVADASTPVTFTVNPVADAWVDSSTPTTNYGTATSLTADTKPSSQSFLKFSLSGITASVTSARLRVFAFSSTNNGPAAFAAGNGWTETGVTWNNRPAVIGNALDDVPVIASGTWVEYNVTPAITGNGSFVFALVPQSSDGVDFYARENAVNRPELVVTFGGPPPPTVSATPAGGSYPDAVDVTLTASEPATIHYTTNGSDPTTGSAVYSGPLSVSVSTTLKFFAVTPDGRPSPIVTEAYSIDVTGHRDFSFGSASAPTAKEGQSKVWHTGDAWFGALFQPAVGDFHIYRLDATTQTWTDTGTLIDGRNTARVDALWDGSKLYTVSAVFGTSSSARAELRRFSYSGGVYTLDSGFPVVLNSTGSEEVVMAKAADGTLWVTYAHKASGKVYVTHSLGSDTSWTAPFVIPGPQSTVSTTTDEASTVVAFGNSIGVMWSNQLDNKVYFGVHANGAPDSSWAIETAYGVPGEESADNHLSLKAGANGRVYAAAKTSLNAVGEPLVNLLVRQPGGGWSSHVWGTADRNHTRPIVVLDEQAGRVHVLASAPCCSGGIIYHKSSSMANISFPAGLGTPVLASENDPEINNVSSTKQSVNATTGLLIIAGDDSTDFYLHSLLDLS